jgi:membrane protease YdiL (CAAX protease family)
MGPALLHGRTKWIVAGAVASQFLVDLFKGFFFPPNSLAQFWAVDLCSHVIIPIVLLVILWRWNGITPAYLGFTTVVRDKKRLEFWPAVITYTVLLAAAYFSGYLVGLALENYLNLPRRMAYGLMVPEEKIASIAVILYFSITAGLFEEIFYRGLYQLAWDFVSPSMSKSVVVISSAIVFAMVHWASGFPAIVGSFLFGLVAAGLFIKQRDLRPLVVGHTLIGVFIFTR